MDTVIREGYVKKGTVLGKTMKRKYLILRCALEEHRTARLEMYDDMKHSRKKSISSTIVSMKSVAGVKRIEVPVDSGAALRDGGYFIRLDIKLDKGGLEELYLGLDARELFEDWLTDLEFLVRLPDLVIPLSILPKREVPLTLQTTFKKNLFGNIDFEDACPVEVLQTELGLRWQFNGRFFILLLSGSSLIFLDPTAGLHALTFNIHNLRRCGHWQKLVFIESGRRTDTGPGYLWLFVHSKVLAKNFYSTLSNVMGNTQHLLVNQRYLCWDKFREELPPGSMASICDDTSLQQGPVSDNDLYLALSGPNDLPPSNTMYNGPPLPPNHPYMMESRSSQPPNHSVRHKTSASQRQRSPSRQEDSVLPPTPLDAMSRRTSLPEKEHRFAPSRSTLSSRSDTFSGVPIKTRYDMMKPEDTQDLHVTTNGQVVTKYNFANTDGMGNELKQKEHSYYDVNDIVAKLTERTSPTPNKKTTLKSASSKYNTISTVKLSSTASKEKIGRSTFYTSALPKEGGTIDPYAEFTDLEDQIPVEVRKERLRQLTIKHNSSMENPSTTGSPFSPIVSNHPNTPLVLYSTPHNIPAESLYKLVDPKPRPIIQSSSSLPENLTVGELALYDSPKTYSQELEYQHPRSNVEFVLPPRANQAGKDMAIDYDHLTEEAISQLAEEQRKNVDIDIGPTSPLYEKMVSRQSLSPEENVSSQNSLDDLDVTFVFQMPENEHSKHALDTLVESQVMEFGLLSQDTVEANQHSVVDTARNNWKTAPVGENIPINQQRDESSQNYSEAIDGIQKPSSQANEKDVKESDYQDYETMEDLSMKDPNRANRDNVVDKSYQNIRPFDKPAPLSAKPKLVSKLVKQESSPQPLSKQNYKTALNYNAKSFAFHRAASEADGIYYAELDLYKDKESTVIVNKFHSPNPATQYDKIDHKVSQILNETVLQHRDPK